MLVAVKTRKMWGLSWYVKPCALRVRRPGPHLQGRLQGASAGTKRAISPKPGLRPVHTMDYANTAETGCLRYCGCSRRAYSARLRPMAARAYSQSWPRRPTCLPPQKVHGRLCIRASLQRAARNRRAIFPNTAAGYDNKDGQRFFGVNFNINF